MDVAKIVLKTYKLVSMYLKYNTRFFKEIGSHAGSNDVKMFVEVNFDVFAKP